MTFQNATDDRAAEILGLIDDLTEMHEAAVRADTTFWNTVRPGALAEQMAAAQAVRDRRYRLEGELEIAKEALDALLTPIAA